MATTIEYQCADGTPFPVEFDDEDDAARRWRRDHEHSRDPATPLGAALRPLAVAGSRRAYEEVGLVLPAGFDRGPRANGFPYFADEFMTPEQMAVVAEGCKRLIEKHGSALAIWHDHCMPRAKEACGFLASADESVPLSALAEQEAYGLQMTMVPAFVCGNDYELLAAACRGVVDGDPMLAAYELTQGYQCETLRADQELWQLGRLAAASTAVSAALSSDDAAAAMASLRASGDEPSFFRALDDFLAEFGGRAESWDVACPTWNEQRDGFWAQLRQMAGDGVPEPNKVVAAGAERRGAVVRSIEARLADDPDALARFRRRLERAAPYVAIREERAHWQLILAGELRGALLRRGARLVERGAIDVADDVLYLLPDELDGGDGRDLRATVAERRADHEFWKTKLPPLLVGGSPESDDAVSIVAALPDDGVLRGVGASRGVVTARARVIVDLEDADRLDDGDVLVCVMTAPPWTPLFGIASAVVVDSGDAGSHPAIAAREYGIPCVLATRVASTVIPDGAMVRVDGERGTVEVLSA